MDCDTSGVRGRGCSPPCPEQTSLPDLPSTPHKSREIRTSLREKSVKKFPTAGLLWVLAGGCGAAALSWRAAGSLPGTCCRRMLSHGVSAQPITSAAPPESGTGFVPATLETELSQHRGVCHPPPALSRGCLRH